MTAELNISQYGGWFWTVEINGKIEMSAIDYKTDELCMSALTDYVELNSSITDLNNGVTDEY